MDLLQIHRSAVPLHRSLRSSVFVLSTPNAVSPRIDLPARVEPRPPAEPVADARGSEVFNIAPMRREDD